MFYVSFTVSCILPKLVPRGKALVKDVAVNTKKKVGEEVHLHTIVRSVNSNKVFGE